MTYEREMRQAHGTVQVDCLILIAVRLANRRVTVLVVVMTDVLLRRRVQLV
jgi:hypothetical protein